MTGSTSWSSCTGYGRPRRPSRSAGQLADFSPYWVEDAIKLDSEDALARLREATDVPFAFGETLAGVHAYKRLFD